ncbi:HNH endonuclease signature motif containing protein [Mycetocola zhujimingii]|uniref:HNH endonuclease signature motif containing protein n=1 Tax=Mycetocola zhujimingii TaxID=2079792 RepID=UPI000D386211|nr:HNH endonuclease signature motif containing protein [Mycetocola zhujimingii]AWB85987.1 hypothetical protein C3E77_04735 [Mycetocola zhujimingii]
MEFDEELSTSMLQDQPQSEWRVPDRLLLNRVPPHWLLPRELPPDDGPRAEELRGDELWGEQVFASDAIEGQARREFFLRLSGGRALPPGCGQLYGLVVGEVSVDNVLIGDALVDAEFRDALFADDLLLAKFPVDDMPPGCGTYDEAPDSPPTPYAIDADALSTLVDDIVAVNEQIAKAHATRARLIDRAREWSEVTARSVVVLGPPRTESEVQELARRSFIWELASALRVPESTASSLIADSEMLAHELPATLEALADGGISYRHAQLMVDQATTLPPDARADFEKQVLPAARSLTAAKFSSRARKLRERTHPESITTRKRSAFDRRRMEFHADLDGMAWVNLYQPAATAMAFYNAIRAEAMTLQRDDEPRTLTQLSLDVAVDRLLDSVQRELPFGATVRLPCGCPDVAAASDTHAEGEPEAESGDKAESEDGTEAENAPEAARVGEKRRTNERTDRRSGRRSSHRPKARRRNGILRGIRPTVIVTVPVMTLMGKSGEPAELEGYGPIDPETARELAGEATSWMRLLVHPETGVPLSLGRKKYKIPRDLRLALEIRDGTCRGPGCNRRATECDMDHTVDWQFAGRSDYANLASMCRPHHRLKHQTTWSVEQVGDGFLEWTSPLGHTYTTGPEVVLPVPPPPRSGVGRSGDTAQADDTGSDDTGTDDTGERGIRGADPAPF